MLTSRAAAAHLGSLLGGNVRTIIYVVTDAAVAATAGQRLQKEAAAQILTKALRDRC